VAVIAFSVAKPFRKPIYTNYPFLISIIMMVLMNSVFLFSPNPGTPPCYMDMGVEMCPNWPGNNPVINFFMLQPFTYMGQSFYNYRFLLLAVIIINSITTLVFEKVFIFRMTKKYDAERKETRAREFAELMAELGFGRQ
jgi:hypothetical protein